MAVGADTALDGRKSDQEAPLTVAKHISDSSSDGSAENIAPSGGFKNTIAKYVLSPAARTRPIQVSCINDAAISYAGAVTETLLHSRLLWRGGSGADAWLNAASAQVSSTS